MLFAAVVLLFISVLLISLVKWYYMKNHFFDKGVGVKYSALKYYPLVGNTLEYFKYKPTEYLDISTKLCFERNGVMLLTVAYIYGLLITDYKLTEHIMSSTIITKKAELYRFLNNWLSTGLLTSNGEKWRKRRKMLTPAFHYQILETFLDVFHSSTDILINVLSKEINNSKNQVVDINNAISHCTLDIICETAMGIKINAQINEESKYVKTVKEISKIFLDRISLPWNFYDIFYQYSATYRREMKCVKYLHNHTRTIIRSRRKELLEKQNRTNSANDGMRMNNKKAFLDILLETTIDDKPLMDEDIREEVDTFMFEGQDTTASAICFALFSIAENPEVQVKILEEQKRIFGKDRRRAPTYNELNSMKYLELVIKETLRLYPSVPIIGREVTKDFEYDGVKFKKDLQLVLFIYGLHRNPDYFPEPERFNPERFLVQENCLESRPFVYIPFSAGPRNCIGQKFAMLEMKSTISKVVRFFELSAVVPKHTLELVPETILRCKNGFPIQIAHRNYDQ